MSHYRERRDKIKNLQSKSLDHLGKFFAKKKEQKDKELSEMFKTISIDILLW